MDVDYKMRDRGHCLSEALVRLKHDYDPNL